MVEPEPLGMRCVGVLDQHLDVRHGSRQLSGKPIDRLLNPFRELLVAGGVLVHGLSVTLSFWGPATILVAVLESFTELVSGSPWTYGAILLVAALDAFFPVVPSETMVVAGGVLAANGDLELGFRAINPFDIFHIDVESPSSQWQDVVWPSGTTNGAQTCQDARSFK